MNPIEFNKIWNALQKEENKVVGERSYTIWRNKNGLVGWLDQGGYKLILEFPNGRVVECFDLYGKEVTNEITPPRIKAKLKAQQEVAKAAKVKKMNAEGDLVIPKEYRELVTKALKIAEIALNENKQATWIINMAQGKNKAKQIGWLLRNVVEAK